jgi:hypothetical protein
MKQATNKSRSVEERIRLAATCHSTVDKVFYLTASDEEIDLAERRRQERQERREESVAVVGRRRWQ